MFAASSTPCRQPSLDRPVGPDWKSLLYPTSKRPTNSPLMYKIGKGVVVFPCCAKPVFMSLCLPPKFKS